MKITSLPLLPPLYLDSPSLRTDVPCLLPGPIYFQANAHYPGDISTGEQHVKQQNCRITSSELGHLSPWCQRKMSVQSFHSDKCVNGLEMQDLQSV